MSNSPPRHRSTPYPVRNIPDFSPIVDSLLSDFENLNLQDKEEGRIMDSKEKDSIISVDLKSDFRLFNSDEISLSEGDEPSVIIGSNSKIANRVPIENGELQNLYEKEKSDINGSGAERTKEIVQGLLPFIHILQVKKLNIKKLLIKFVNSYQIY